MCCRSSAIFNILGIGYHFSFGIQYNFTVEEFLNNNFEFVLRANDTVANHYKGTLLKFTSFKSQKKNIREERKRYF